MSRSTPRCFSRCLAPSASFMLAVTLFAGTPVLFSAQSSSGKVSYIPYAEAKPIIEALNEVLPAELRAAGENLSQSTWTSWVTHRDQEIRARLIQGDEDSLVNFWLFGTSFTTKPRITLEAVSRAQSRGLLNSQDRSPEANGFFKILQSRADDLTKAMNAPGENERLLFARQLMEGKGYDVKVQQSRERVRDYLFANLARVLNEQAGYSRILKSAQLLGDPSAEFAERSKLFSTRGLSSDTSILPNFALESALASVKREKLLAPASVRRVGIIGPGLDFTDKQDGYDFYPLQTIQPFAVIDALLRLGLSNASDLRVTTFDLSPRINEHLMRARRRAQKGTSYVVQLPRDAQAGWKPETIDYWARFGERIGSPVAPVEAPAAISDLKTRAVRIRPEIVSRVSPEDLNVVLQRLDPGAGREFDLIIATNILVYYDVFEQSLALSNIERMLRPGGLLLSNNALLELPSSQMRSVGYETVVYSDKPTDGDHIVWYQRLPDKRIL